jgi:hypothetical protein
MNGEKTDMLNGPSKVLPSRRTFLADCGLGFTGLALGAMLADDGVLKANEPGSWQPPNGKPHFAPKAKSVIWLFMNGGASHVESFDPKPEITKYAGQSISETPYADTQDPNQCHATTEALSVAGRLSQVRRIRH